jgi:hypothetical protein
VIAGVVVTGDKFLTSVNDIGEQLSPVTATPAINLLPVTRTRMPWRWGAAKDVDTGKQFIGGVVDTGEQFISGENEK